MQIYLNKSHSSTCRFIFMLKRLNFECKSVSESQNVVACCVDVVEFILNFFSPPFRLCFVLFRSRNSQRKNRWPCENNMATHDFRWSHRGKKRFIASNQSKGKCHQFIQNLSLRFCSRLSFFCCYYLFHVTSVASGTDK